MKGINLRKLIIHLGLFLITLVTTTIAGAEHATGKIFAGWGLVSPEGLLKLDDWHKGLPYAISFLAFLSFHEFGHYFTSLYHKVKCTLPFYIPVYIPIPGAVNIGSFGAVIRLKQRPSSTDKYFDIGIAGPLAGFMVSIFLLIYGFTHLPPLEEYVYSIHPEYKQQFGRIPSPREMRAFLEAQNVQSYQIGSSLLFEILKRVIPSDPAQIPPHFELMHYPFLFVGYLTLFFTALNLLPIGQLDGGHVMYGMFGARVSSIIARGAVIGLLLLGGTGIVDIRTDSFSNLGWVLLLRIAIYYVFIVYVLRRVLQIDDRWKVYLYALSLLMIQIALKWFFPSLNVNFIWLFYSFLVVRFVGVDHPSALVERRINLPRQILGWVAILIFILCFSPEPLKIMG